MAYHRGMRAVRHIALALALLPAVAHAKGLDPETAASKREQIESSLDSSPRAAIDQLQDAGDESGDPELFLQAATLALDEAKSSRDAELAERAAELARIAADIGLYLADSRNYDATDWRPVTRERAAELADEADALVETSQALSREIHEERAAAAAAAAQPAEEPERRRRKAAPGTGMIIGGSAALVIGGGGVGLLVAGLTMGAANQREAESLVLPAELPRLSELDRKGATANMLAYVGGAVAGVGVIAGATLIALGVKRRKAAGPSAQANVHVGGYFTTHSAGLSLTGRF
jgi:hypothetical protein